MIGGVVTRSDQDDPEWLYNFVTVKTHSEMFLSLSAVGSSGGDVAFANT